MSDLLDKLTDDVKKTTVEYCVKVCEIHRIPAPENEYQRGYNAAVKEIADKIRRLP